ncbi:hypothetical protein [Megalodesulfovibrio paquesii]
MDIQWIEESEGPLALTLKGKTPPLLVQGNIVSARAGSGKADHFEILSVREDGESATATIRRITPNFWRTAQLGLGLAAGWFIVEYLLKLVLP